MKAVTLALEEGVEEDDESDGSAADVARGQGTVVVAWHGDVL